MKIKVKTKDKVYLKSLTFFLNIDLKCSYWIVSYPFRNHHKIYSLNLLKQNFITIYQVKKQMKLSESVLHEQRSKAKVNFMQRQEHSESSKVQKMRRQEPQSDENDFFEQKKENKTRGQELDKGSQASAIKQENKKDKNIGKQASPQNISSKILIRSLFSYIRQLKTTPTKLVYHLQKREKKYDPQNPLIYYPFAPKDLNFCVRTREGKEGVSELIGYLERLETRQSDGLAKEVNVEWSHELHLAARKRVEAIEKGDVNVQSLDVGQLVNEFASWKGPLFEIIVYGFIDPKEIMIEAFLQDDSALKSNRSQFFNQGGKLVGIDMGQHEKYRVVTVMIFAGEVKKIQKNNNSFSNKSQADQQCQCIVF